MLEGGLLAHACNPSTLKVEAGESGVQGLPQQENQRLKTGFSHPVGSRPALVKKKAGVTVQG